MDSVLVKAENVSKAYCKNLKRSLWYGVKDIASDIVGRKNERTSLRPHEFWALEDISFGLKKGESLGLIGRNGAGKTTLLKLINGLIKPTKGRITINGSIGALIALGTGFNPILTGRENVKIAGAVLGFSEKEMTEKLEEILEFSDIGDFIDAPVQSYSSGMLVRLGFSVAIQMNPDILLVDEVLAVGDLSFAVKCQKKITEYRNNGGSLILVSHGMHNVRFHCDKAIWLDGGQIQAFEESHVVCNKYEMFSSRQSKTEGQRLYFDDAIEIGYVEYPKVLESGNDFIFEFEVNAKRKITTPIIEFGIFHVTGQHLISNHSQLGDFTASFEQGTNRIRLKYDRLLLSPGVYTISLVISENELNNHLAFFQNAFKFEVRSNEQCFGLLNLKPKWDMIGS